MPQVVKDAWAGLSAFQRNVVVVVVAGLVAFVLASYVFAGTDWSWLTNLLR